MHFVIIGNGVAGINAAGQIRNRDKAADITIISNESDHFFSRTALMYLFCGQLSETDIEPFPRDHYKRMNYNRVSDEVIGLDAANKTLKTAAGKDISYDRLLIASGSIPRTVGWPGEKLPQVGNFVTWQNLEWLKQTSRNARRACILGGGLIGIETVEILQAAGIQTSFLIREDWFWPIALNKDEGDIVTAHMKHHGIDVQLKTMCREILGKDNHVEGVLTEDGRTFPCDLVVITIGVMPQTGWLSDSGIELDKSGGIVTGDHMETNLPDVWAAGDCTSVVWFNGVRRPEQLWYTSRDQGRAAGINMVGEPTVYKRGVFYNSAKFFDIEYTTAGYVNFNFEGEKNWYLHESDTNHTARITYLPDETVVGFNFLGRRWDHSPLVRWVEEKRPLDWVLKNLHTANFDEEFYSKFKPVNGS